MRAPVRQLLQFVRVDGRQGSNVMWLCRCECGKEARVRASRVVRNVTISCGCVAVLTTSNRNTKHGHNQRGERSSTYTSWRAMINRCTLPGAHAYRWYGARGISVCDRWSTFDAFLADMGPRPPGMTIERLNVNGNYEPTNCVWATWETQARNKR